jgi:hypothetical protein
MNEMTNSKPQPPDDNWITREFIENRQKFPPEGLIPYAEKHIAWSWDGTHIVASADSDEELIEKVKAMGLNPSRVVYAYVESPYTFCAGSGFDFCPEYQPDIEELLKQVDPKIRDWLLAR